MFAIQFVSNEIFPLKRSDTAENALLFMEDWQVKELPVVELGKVIGFVTYAITAEWQNERVEQFMLPPQPFVVGAKLHLFDVWNHFAMTGFTTLAIENSEGNYEGIIQGREMAIQAYTHSALVQEGAVLVLEIEAIQYSLAEITRICETNEAKIIHLMVEPIKNETNILQVSIKLNKAYPAHVMASLERFGYKVIFSNGAEDPKHSLEDRFRWLVKYLNT